MKEKVILVKLSAKENRLVEIYKAVHGLDTKSAAIKQIILTAERSLRDGLKNGL